MFTPDDAADAALRDAQWQQARARAAFAHAERRAVSLALGGEPVPSTLRFELSARLEELTRADRELARRRARGTWLDRVSRAFSLRR